MKKILLLLIFFISILMLTACSIKKDNEMKEVIFWTLQMNDFADYIVPIIRNFEKENPTIKIKWVDIPFSEGEKRTLTAIMSNTPPDLINLNPDFSALLAQKNVLEKIDEKYISEYNQEIIEVLKYNDKIYSLPWYATSAVTIYNKDLFFKSEIIKLPKTYEDLDKIAKKIKDKTGAYAYFPTLTENDTMIKILNKYGINIYENLENAKSVFNMFKQQYKNDLIPKESITFTQREALEQYMAGKIVFFEGGANFLNLIKENAPSIYEKTDVCSQIKGSIGQNNISVMNFVIPKKAKNKKEALQFYLFLTNNKNQLELAKRANIIAVKDEILKNEFYNNINSLEKKALSISAKQINNIRPIYIQQNRQKEINILINSITQEILLKDKDINKALKELSFTINNL